MFSSIFFHKWLPIIDKMIPLQCAKLLMRVSYLFVNFDTFTKTDLTGEYRKEMSIKFPTTAFFA